MEGQAEEMKILNEFLNSYLRQFPEKRKVKAMEVLGELAGGIIVVVVIAALALLCSEVGYYLVNGILDG